jgi:hypothetical protein
MRKPSSDERTRLLLPACTLLALAFIAPAGCVSPGGIDTSAMSFSSEPLLGKIVWNDLVTVNYFSQRESAEIAVDFRSLPSKSTRAKLAA